LVYIRIEAEVKPTEDVSKVLRAIKNIIDTENIKIEDIGNEYKVIIVEETNINSLKKLHSLLRRQKILDSARNILLRHLKGNSVEFKLNKQAVYQGVISFVESDTESPLGAITILITSPKINLIIDWLTPRTSRGKPIWEIEPPSDA